MFIGEFRHNVDDKGRIAIPAKFRADLAQGMVVTRGLDNCLFIYTLNEWQQQADKLKTLPITQADARAFVRLMFAGASEGNLDKQGRVILPSYLLEYAKIEKAAVVAGLYNRIEVWSQSAWEDYTKRAESESSKIAEQLAALGI